MSIEDRNLKPGTRLVARYKKQDFTCEVVKTKEGVIYRLADGQEFKSLSSAGSAVMGGSACNGWRFWSLEGEARPKTSAAPARTPRAEQVIKPMKGAEGRFWCSACQDAFASDESDPTCPKGHSNAQPEEPPTEMAKPAKKASAKQTKKAPAKRKAAAKAKA